MKIKIKKPKLNMNFRFKIPKLNLKIRLPKLPEKLKSKKLLVLLIVLLVLIVAGVGISRIFLKEKAPAVKTPEKVQTEQTKEQKPEPETALNANLQNHLASDFIKTLKSGKYMIKYKTTTVYEGQSIEVETSYAVSGSSIVLVSKDRATIVKDNRVYMLNHTDKTMLSWNVDKSSGDLKRIDTEGLTYIGSTSENGLVCEEYKTASSDLKLYFKDKTLVKIVTVINGLETEMNIVEVSNTVPESMFQVPQGYESTEL